MKTSHTDTALAPESDRPSDSDSLRFHFTFRAVDHQGVVVVKSSNSADLPSAYSEDHLAWASGFCSTLVDGLFAKPVMMSMFCHFRDRITALKAAKTAETAEKAGGKAADPSRARGQKADTTTAAKTTSTESLKARRERIVEPWNSHLFADGPLGPDAGEDGAPKQKAA
jgi:hypothetical protein